MGILIIFLILYNIFGKSNPKVYGKVKNNFGKIFGIIIFLSIFSSTIPSGLYVTLAVAIALAMVCAPFFVIYKVLQALFGNNKSSHYKSYYDNKVAKGNSYVSSQSQSRAKQKMDSMVSGLTKSVPKRKKIVKKFSDKYDLNLTEEEISLIVDSSYMSYFWEKEIFDMSQDYDVVVQWYKSDTAWLRAYLRVFPVQSVSSDYERQRQICVEIFDEIFNKVNPSSYGSVDECIDAINRRYMTSFDETTFMIAYRFLEDNGKKHELPRTGIIGGGSELDRLMERYDQEKGADGARKGRRDNGTRAF